MESGFLIFIVVLSAFAASVSGVSTAFSYTFQKISEIRNLKSIKKQSLDSIIDSANIDVFRDYLDNTIGKITIQDYVHNHQIHNLVNEYFDQLSHFLEPENDIDKVIKKPKGSKVVKEIESTDEFIRIQAEYEQGELWNSLARLRRHIEITLKAYLRNKDVKIEGVLSAGIVLNMLKKRDLITNIDFDTLKYILSVCNKAVHGESVSQLDAHDSIYLASSVLRKYYV
ncbi:hypothetical protein [Leptospira licerasiae]|uniref:hypothetical protein n=1 Tax=Leptospira licerasiae TaxID=447106 RepID=UPI0010847B9A|nr:hypothetical protein [Leptospira licerasiae]TGM85594.1 hypothetical protein EHR05_18760 [Leptospira licerasiae]